MRKNRDTLIDACYQYLLDHTIPSDKGPCVSFILVSEGEFKRRIRSREKGYKRVHKSEIIDDPMKVRNSLPYVKQAKTTLMRIKRKESRSLVRGQLEKRGSIWTKLVFRLRRWCDKYINQLIDTELSKT